MFISSDFRTVNQTKTWFLNWFLKNFTVSLYKEVYLYVKYFLREEINLCNSIIHEVSLMNTYHIYHEFWQNWTSEAQFCWKSGFHTYVESSAIWKLSRGLQQLLRSVIIQSQTICGLTRMLIFVNFVFVWSNVCFSPLTKTSSRQIQKLC